MCNIAGYAGNKQAAPILMEMLRRQELYDGDMSTGIATIHEGKLYYRKIVGNVDAMLRETDVLDLPGTIGIAHSRPGGSNDGIPYHPFISMDKKTALVTNGGTPTTQYTPGWNTAVDMLDQLGYVFEHEDENPKDLSPKLSKNGHYVSPAEARVFLVEHYMKQGKTATEAMAITCAHMYSDNATVMITENTPDSFHALRTTRPLVAATAKGETYMATTRYGLPEDWQDRASDLPLFHACVLSRDGILISGDKMEMEPVWEMTPYTYYEAYKRFDALLKSEKAPMYFDELEFAAGDMRDLWPGDHTHVQHARLVYDLLRQFDAEGRLKREVRVQQRPAGTRRRYYFWLED